MSLIAGRIGFVWFLLTRPGAVPVLVNSIWCRCEDNPSAWPPLDTGQVAAVCRLLCVLYLFHMNILSSGRAWYG
jgi:hypothetical protein